MSETALKITRTDRRLLSALDEDGDMTPGDLADHLEYDNHGWISRKLLRLQAAELVRVSRWIRNTDGRAIPVYSITHGTNAKRPKAQGWAVWSRNYRRRLKERGGERFIKARNSLALLVCITSRRQA
jgi:predicted ArsR family transcriptional regulator